VKVLLDFQLNRLIQDRDETALKVLGHIVEPFGIDPRSRRLQAAVKALRTAKAMRESDVAHHFKSRLQELRGIPDDVVRAFADQAIALIGTIDSDLFMGRSEISTVGAVLRPLDIRWAQNLMKSGEYEELDRLSQYSEYLREQRVDSIAHLRNWFAQMYEAFDVLCVYRLADSNKKPMGMIRESNRRMYLRNWIKWTNTDENVEMVFEMAQALEGGKTPDEISPRIESSNGFAPYGSSRTSLAVTGAATLEQTYFLSGPAASTPVSNVMTAPERVQVTLVASSNSEQMSTKVWDSRKDLKQQVKNWVEVTSESWGEDGSLLNFTISKDEGNSLTTVQRRTPSQATESLMKLVDL
jgi:hypothetical protein